MSSIRNITLCGIGYLGKSFLMEMTYNKLIKEFVGKNIHSKYNFLPFIQFYRLKYYSVGKISEKIKNNIDPVFIFLGSR